MTRLLLPFFTALSLFYFSVQTRAQDLPMKHYTVEDGLPSNIVYEVYRDSKGFLWFATEKGIARYNGIKFETFSTYDGLPDNSIFFFQEDYYGRLWMATYNGELCYYKNDTFHTAVNTPFLRTPVKFPFIQFITPQPDSSITICFEEQLTFLNIGKGTCKEYTITGQPPGLANRIMQVHKKQNGFEIILDTAKLEVDEHARVRGMVKFDERRIECLVGQNKTYYYTRRSIFDVNNNVIFNFKNHHYPDYALSRIYKDGDKLFFAGKTGLIINDSLQLLKKEKVSSITQDDGGNYYVATLGGGVYVLSNNLFNTALVKSAYKDDIIFSHSKSSKLFFATAHNNLFYLHHDTIQCLFDHKNYKRNNIQYSPEPGYLLDDNYKYYIYFNDNLIVVDNVFAKRPLVTEYIHNYSVGQGAKYVLADDDNIYIATRRLIKRIDHKPSEGGKKGAFHEKVIKTNEDRIYGMAQNTDNAIWYSTVSNMYKIENGVCVLQPQFNAMALRRFLFIGSQMVGYTQNNQMFICSNINDKVTVDSVMLDNCVLNRLYRIDSNKILITTNNLYRLLTLHGGVTGKKYSIAAIENPFIPLQAEAISIDSNVCYFFKNGDITSITVNSLLAKPLPPKLFFRRVRTAMNSYSFASEIQIPYKEAKDISILFSTLSTSSVNVFYQYYISGSASGNWRDFTGDLNLADPDFGTYTIKVRAKTASSEYSVPLMFTLKILRPWWASWWFITLSIGMVIAAGALISHRRITYALRKREQEHLSEVRFMKSEYKALNALMNPHFIFNTLNNVQALVNKDDKRAANEYLRVFADLVRQNMQNVSKELIPLEKEMTLVKNYLLLEKLRFEDTLNYSIDIDEEIDLSEIMVPPLLIQPLVENAIKHGIYPMESANGVLHIRLYEIEGTLKIEVKDNGVGIDLSRSPVESTHESSALENIRKRIASLRVIQNKEITLNIDNIKDETGKQQWAVVTVSLPFSGSSST